MVLIIVDGYVLSANVRNIFFIPFFIAFYNIILDTLRDIPTLVRITLFPTILLNKQQYDIWYRNQIHDVFNRGAQSWYEYIKLIIIPKNIVS